MEPKIKRPWFKVGDADGIRSLADQVMGLAWLMDNVRGRTVLDIGCAEGLLAVEMAKAGAIAVHGVERRAAAVQTALQLRGDLPISFEVVDGNTWTPPRQYDIVCALSVLQKLADPTAAALRFAAAARWSVVLKLPPLHAPRIIHKASNFVEHDIGAAMTEAGFTCVASNFNGYNGEWVGNYVRSEHLG